MNPDVGPRPSPQPGPEAQKSALGVTQILFRAFLLSALGSFFVFSLNVNYVWLSAILTLAGIVLGIVVLVRAVKYKHSKLVLFGTISGLVQAGHNVPGLHAVGADGDREVAVLVRVGKVDAGRVALASIR